MLATLPDALADALARVISDFRREMRLEFERTQAEHRAEMAEFRAQTAERIAATKACADGEVGRIREALARVRDGRDGRDADPDYMRELAVVEVARAMAELPAPQAGERGEPGKDADEELIVEKVLARMPLPEKGDPGERGDAGPQGEPGKDADLETIVGMMLERMPLPEKGDPGEPGRDGVDGQKGDPGPPGEPGRDGEDGEDAVIDPKLLSGLIDEAVDKVLPLAVGRAITAFPVPKDGRDGIDGAPGPEGAPGRDGIGEKGDPGPEGRPGRDAADIADAFRTYDGKCLLTLTDGRVLDLGVVQGKDGAPGRDGIDGKDGRDGVDGLSIEDLSTEFDGERKLTLRLARGDIVKENNIILPHPLDRGVYKAGVKYERGDSVSFGGCMWIAQRDTDEKPNGPETGWRLAVKAGRDGRDGQAGAKGERGPEGKPGRDLTFGSQK